MTDDLADELAKTNHSIALLQYKFNEKGKDIESLTPFPINKVWTSNKNKKGGRKMWPNAVIQLFDKCFRTIPLRQSKT